MINRRQFLHDSVLASAAFLALRGARSSRFLIETLPQASLHRRLTERELLRGLSRLQLGGEIRMASPEERPTDGDLVFRFHTQPDQFKNQEAYSIVVQGALVSFHAATDIGLLYAVFDFLEHQGAYLGTDGESYPPEATGKLALPAEHEAWEAAPRFAVRGLLPWPDFLNCISNFNEEDFRAYFEAMLRMRLNTFGMHVYSQQDYWAESYLSFEFAGTGHTAFLDNTASARWGYLPERTSRFTMGGSQYYDSEVFGSDATRLGRTPWEIAERTRTLLSTALSYARTLGIATGIGFEPYQIPDEIWKALPPEVKPPEDKPDAFHGARFDVESVTARKMLEARLGQLLEAYPDVDQVWLWEDEQMNWDSRKTGIPLSTSPFLQAHDFLRRNAPKKRMILSGWGGVARNFEYFHKKLPGDIVFACLNDSLGWDPVNEVFGKLEGRERWPIPWLEDDPGMWLPQFHVHRTQRDVNLAEAMGCQGILGIHWRHRIMDPTAGYLARATWNKTLTPDSHYKTYAGSQASGQRAVNLASVLSDTDLNQKLLNTGTQEREDGHEVTREFSGDYDEAFAFWNDHEPSKEIAASQKGVAAALRAIANLAGSPLEQERLEYLTGFVEFAVSYTDAWSLAHRLHLVLNSAAKLKKAGDLDGARENVRQEGLPLWKQLAPMVRDAMLRYQRIVATRNDLGQLASMHNKFVRLALYRLPLSIQEYLGEFPAESEQLFQQVVQPDPSAPTRLFVPTRPGILKKDDRVRIMIIATGAAPVQSVTLSTRARGVSGWTQTEAQLMGRRTWQATLGPFESALDLVEYYVSASIGGARHVAPPGAPNDSYLITMA
jgi:hypothetical protein